MVGVPWPFIYANLGGVGALSHGRVPFVGISFWASLQRIDPAVERAAVSLGAGRAAVLRRVIVPLAMPGILSGSVVVFALAASAFATPAIIGGSKLTVISTAAYDEFLNTLDWTLVPSLAVLLLTLHNCVLPTANRMVDGPHKGAFHECLT